MSGKYGSPSFAVLLVDGNNLLAAKVQSFSWKKAAQNQKSDGLGDSFKTKHPTGLTQGSFAQAGAFFDDTQNGMHDALKSKQQIPRVLVAAYAGNVIGQQFVGAAGFYGQAYEVLGAQAGLTNANVTYEVTGIIDTGLILQEYATRNDDWTATPVDGGASSAFGGAGYLAWSDFLGPNGFVGTIEHSDDANTWATLITFDTVVGGPGAQRIAVAGTVKRWLRFRGFAFGNLSASASVSASLSPSVSASSSSSLSRSPSASTSPSGSTSLSPSSSRSPSASTSLSPSASQSPSVSASASTSYSLSPSLSASASVSPSSGGVTGSSIKVFCGFARYAS